MIILKDPIGTMHIAKLTVAVYSSSSIVALMIDCCY